jgi:multimeric flavodoxin WrbA
MILFVGCSNKKGNCSKLVNDLKEDSDQYVFLSEKNIKFCLGCDKCANKLESKCVQLDDMQDIYRTIEKSDKIIFVIPIYFDNVCGLFKNFVDRLNPLYHAETLKGKDIYFITVGEESEEENDETSKHLNYFFSKLSQVFEFNYKYLRNLSTGESGSLVINYPDYTEIVEELKKKIG